jgi:methyl-accepting chemotaxis protein
MIRSSIINTLTVAVLLLLCAACVGGVIGMTLAYPSHPLIAWFARMDVYGLLWIFILLGLVTLALRVVIAHYVSRPLYKIRDDIFALAKADDAHIFSEHARNDEFGELANTLRQCQGLLQRAREADDARAQVLTANTRRKEQLESHIAEFDSRVNDVVRVVNESAQTLHSVAEGLLQAVLVSQRQVGQMRESVTKSSEQIGSIADDSNTIHYAISDMVQVIRKAAEESGAALKQTKDASASTEQLTIATQKISGVIQLIRKITEKINLLALNAGIESVRAGEAGKGFAVVAQEVKTLATQTKRATEDIVDNIMALQDCTSATDHLLHGASEGMEHVAKGNADMLDHIKAQHKLTNNIAYNMQQTTMIIRDVANNIDGIHNQISEIDGASKNVTSAARQLNAQSSVLSQEVRRFIYDIEMSGQNEERAA